jgi:hypothetical protein
VTLKDFRALALKRTAQTTGELAHTSLNHFLLLWGDRIEAATARGGR